jgi:hypothetical protein
LQALLHDASEAYLSDVARPVKHSPEYTFYRKVERRVQSLIYEYFNCDPEEAPELKKADDAALGLEAYWLMEVRRGDDWDCYLDAAEACWGALDQCATGYYLGTLTPALTERELVSQVRMLQRKAELKGSGGGSPIPAGCGCAMEGCNE